MSVTIRVDIDSARVMASLEAMPVLIEGEAVKAMETSTHIVEAEVKALTPRRTGRLFSGWQTDVKIAGNLTGIIANKVEYAAFIEGGTSPHEIVAKGNALVFKVAGKTVFAKRVQHPGFVGRHMARIAAATSAPEIARIFRDAVKDAVRISLGR